MLPDQGKGYIHSAPSPSTYGDYDRHLLRPVWLLTICLTIDEAVIYFNIGEKKLRKLVSDNLDSGFIIQNGVKFLIKRKRFEDFLNDLTAI